MMQLTAFTWVPDFARGNVRDVRARWALEEAGIPYEEILLDQGDQNSDEYRDTMQPFAQIPALKDGDLTLFESGAIVLYLGERSETLLPADLAGRARATAWVIAALNSVEPHTQANALLDVFYKGEEWARLRKPGAEALARKRLAGVERRLQGREWLEDRFTAGDLVMATVVRSDPLLSDYPALKAFAARCETRPAFQRAMRDHLAALTGKAPAAA